MGFGKTFRDVYSTALLILCTVIIMDSVFARNTKFAEDYNPWVAFFALWGGLAWLSMVEGGQASLVGLPPVDMTLYEKSHPITHGIMKIVNKGDNLDRYLMGRQFLVLALVFLENNAGDPHDKERLILGVLPYWINQSLIQTGLAIFFMTAMIGKISAQVNASRCMLEYVNSYIATFTLYVSMFIELSGLLHCCYLAQILFAQAAGQPLVSKEEPRNAISSLFFWLRVLASSAVLVFAFAVTLSALFNNQTTMWEGVPPEVTVVLFFLFMAVVGMLEGMQIAFFAVAKMSAEEREKSAWAKRTCAVLFANDGRNLPGFMVGRQMCVTMCFFIIARVTTIRLNEGDGNIFGYNDGVQIFFETGLLGALITTIVASIMWQLIASSFPMAFLSTPITYVLLRWCLFLEWTGLCQGAWVFALIIRKVVGYKRDEVFIGTAEERRARALGDPSKSADNEDYNVVPGHMYPGVPVLPPNFAPRTNNLEEIMQLEQELVDHKHDVDTRLANLQAKKEKFTLQIESKV